MKAIQRRSLPDSVFEQLREDIVRGHLAAGADLPSERDLCEALAVNRGALREGLKRLEQARLITIRHGGPTRVLDYRRSAGPELLGVLLADPDGRLDRRVARSVVEMRASIGPDVARLAAERATADDVARLEALAAELAAEGATDAPAVLTARRQDVAARFWERLVAASGNVAYQLLNNALREVYDRLRGELAGLLRAEIEDAAGYGEIALAVGRRDPAGARAAAERLLGRGTGPMLQALARLEPAEEARS